MKKIKILKDIAGYKAGETISSEQPIPIHMFDSFADYLVKEGLAEEVRDDIDIEAIRKEANTCYCNLIGGYHKPQMTENEYQFLKAYRIVKAVIDQLNGDWKPDWSIDEENKWFVVIEHSFGESYSISLIKTSFRQFSILPPLKDKETAQKVIELCEPELKVLFNVK